MKTYSEAQTGKTFDWNAFLNKETYTTQELKNAYLLSEEWVTCACGNQCEVIPRDEIGKPLDEELANLGWRFTGFIHAMKMSHDTVNERFENSRKLAQATLLKIEKRSITLINEQL